jgi:hypothetical protein
MIIKSKLTHAGDARTVKRFAWLPERLNDGIVVWLQFYWADQERGSMNQYWYDKCYYLSDPKVVTKNNPKLR